jgi:hypothetical protein
MSGRCVIACALAWSCSSNDRVVISEFMASNDSTLTDEEGEFGDWIELHNVGATSVNLDGWFITDDAKVPRRFRLPDVRLPAGEYLVVFATGKNRVRANEPLHTNFRLRAASDYLALVRPSGSVTSEVRPYPEQRADISYGTTATGEVDFLAQASPGRPNSHARRKRTR